MHCHSVQSMPILRGSGGMPPRNFERLHSLRLNLRAILVLECPRPVDTGIQMS